MGADLYSFNVLLFCCGIKFNEIVDRSCISQMEMISVDELIRSVSIHKHPENNCQGQKVKNVQSKAIRATYDPVATLSIIHHQNKERASFLDSQHIDNGDREVLNAHEIKGKEITRHISFIG